MNLDPKTPEKRLEMPLRNRGKYTGLQNAKRETNTHRAPEKKETE
jgi:hypothetical protein